jgi:hypothetical protein
MTEAFACGTAAVITPIGAVKSRRASWTMGSGQSGHDRKAEAGPLPRPGLATAVEPVEDAGGLLGVEPGALVGAVDGSPPPCYQSIVDVLPLGSGTCH